MNPMMAGAGQLRGLLLEALADLQQRGVLVRQRAALPLGLLQQRAQLGAASRDLQRDGQRLAHREQELAGPLLPRLQAGELEQARHLSCPEQRHQRHRLRSALHQAGADVQLVAGRSDDGDLRLQHSLARHSLPGPERGVRVPPVERVPADQPEDSVRSGGVQGAHRATEVRAEKGHRPVGSFIRLQLAAELLHQPGASRGQPVGAAALRLEPFQALRHLVGLAGQIAQLVAAHHRDGLGEVALAESAEPGGERLEAAQEGDADPDEEQEHHRQAGDGDRDRDARAGALGVVGGGERAGQLGLVEGGGPVEQLGHALLPDL